MKLTLFAIERIAPFIVAKGSGKEIIRFLANYGIRDVYDDLGMPDIGKRSGNRPTKTEYVKKRLAELADSNQLRSLLTRLVNDNPEIVSELNEIIQPENFSIVQSQNGDFTIEGGVIGNTAPVINEAHFKDIQNRILKALDEAQVSIRVLMAWFTNEKLFQKLIEKHNQSIDVKVAIYDDGINRKHGVDISQLPNVMIKKGQKGGLMHNKFAVIDNQVVITGSYNWSDNAEFRNDENITVEYDPKQATSYSVEFRRLTKEN